MGRTNLLAHMLRNPLTTGSVAPSSKQLARAMAERSRGADHIIELGGGTGAVTRALREVCRANELTVVELQPQLARKLADVFPGSMVVQAPAAEALAELAPEGRVALVSSLPFRSLPASIREETIAAILKFLVSHPSSWLVQFTYLPGVPFEVPSGFTWAHQGTAWRNLPPARVWVLRPNVEPA